jgi:hypothetical protein
VSGTLGVAGDGARGRASRLWQPSSIPSARLFEPSSEYELATGQHVAGTTSDITISIDPGYLKYLDLAPNLTYNSQVPSNQYNPIVEFLHELEHGFGMTGWYSQSGQLPGNYESNFDTFIQKTASGAAYFIGPNAEAAYGGPVPLTTSSTAGENYYHFGNTLSDINKTPATVQDPLTLDLMNGIVFFFDYQYQISPLDLAVLKDLGYNVTEDLISAQAIENDYFAITRTALSVDQATSIANAIQDATQTEAKFVNGLLAQVADTTIPAVAVEGSMYNAVGSSDEITKLVTLFLPAQVANAVKYGYPVQVYACEALGLAFAFGDENGKTGFGQNFGPSNAAMPTTPAGDAAFAAAATSAIFGSSANPNTKTAVLNFVTNWESFYTSHGIPGIGTGTAAQIDLAARGAAWGDAVGVAVANNLGLLPGQVINFLEDATQGSAIYSAALASQPTASPFQGVAASAASAASFVQLIGVTAQADHIVH